MTPVVNVPKYKFLTIMSILLLIIIFITVRLWYLQVHLNQVFWKQGQKNFLRFETVVPPRGNIIDINGNLLATNRPVHNLYWKGGGSATLKPEQQAALLKLETILNCPITSNNELMSSLKRNEKQHKKILLQQDLSFEQLCQLEEIFPNNSNLCLETDFQRLYPYQSCASHILGYLGNVKLEATGKMGLEQLFEEQLRGKHGTNVKTINSHGRNLTSQTMQEALTGKTIRTTLNLPIQQLAENAFPDYQKGTCILMNPKDGSIVALVSRPNFDPNAFLNSISMVDWESMQDRKFFLNRAFSACYPPGSIFKLITASAALEEKLITPETCWQCRGYITFGLRKYLCQCNRNFGSSLDVTATQALTRSCNTFFYEIGKKISIDTLADYANRFGLGQKATSTFNEKIGLVPTSAWKLQVKGERWWPGETLSATIGQSFILVTPIQIARMIGSIFTGYLVTPRIIADDPIMQQPLEISAKTREFLQQSMKSVITQGTGRRISRIKNIEIYAKTSTAQTSSLEKSKLGSQFTEHGWFVAYFRYKHHEPLVLVLLVEHVGSSSVAVGIAKNFLIEYKKYADSLPS